MAATPDDKNQKQKTYMGKKKAATDSQFAKESASQLPAVTTGPSPAMLALFAPKDGADPTAKLVRRNMPMLVKPDMCPVGGIVSGTIVSIVDSPVSTIKGKLLWLRHESGQEFTFPVTGTIRNALAPGVKDDDAKLTAALEKEVGKTFVAKRLPDKPSKFKKSMFMFDVYTTDK